MIPDKLKHDISAVFSRWAAEGVQREGAILSHICLKFASAGDYVQTVGAARSLGAVTQQSFKGKEISWCKLDTPLRDGAQSFSWLELVEPKDKLAPVSGVASIGYCVEWMTAAVKTASQDGGVVFRYQELHAAKLAQL